MAAGISATNHAGDDANARGSFVLKNIELSWPSVEGPLLQRLLLLLLLLLLL